MPIDPITAKATRRSSLRAASTPLITSLMDVLGLMIYFSIAVAILT
jgi:hypothetical protein